jgi:hypothetical protein
MEYDFEKLAKEFVIERLKDVEDPYSLAGEAVRKILVAALPTTRDKQEPRVTVSATCRGIMSGMLLIEKDLPKTAVALLTQTAQVADESGLDPADCMTWAMEGIAPVAKMGHGSSVDAVSNAIEENFMGAGDVFNNIARTAGA